MYERFTDRARKVMQLANQAAQKLNHEYIGTEHILLGLLKNGAGVGITVLKNLGLNLAALEQEVLRVVAAGPDTVTEGKLPQTPRAKKVIEYSIEESRGLNHNYVGTEHLLLGLIRETEGIAAQVLAQLGVTLARAREAVHNVLEDKKELEMAEMRAKVVDAVQRSGLVVSMGSNALLVRFPRVTLEPNDAFVQQALQRWLGLPDNRYIESVVIGLGESRKTEPPSS